MIAERLAALREAATPGPWFLHFREDDQWGPMAEWISENGLSEEDAALMVALVNAAPQIEAQSRTLAEIEAKMVEWESECRRLGVWRDSDADAQMCRWVRDKARAALAELEKAL